MTNLVIIEKDGTKKELSASITIQGIEPESISGFDACIDLQEIRCLISFKLLEPNQRLDRAIAAPIGSKAGLLSGKITSSEIEVKAKFVFAEMDQPDDYWYSGLAVSSWDMTTKMGVGQ